MSSGHPDYIQKVAPIPEIIGDDENEYTAHVYDTAAPSDILNLLSYTVPAGIDLYISMVVISCTNPGTNLLAMSTSVDYIMQFYFDTCFVMPLKGINYFKVASGETLEMAVLNGDDQVNTFSLEVRGYEKTL